MDRLDDAFEQLEEVLNSDEDVTEGELDTALKAVEDAVNEEIGAQEVIRKEGDKWRLYTKDGKKVLGEFDSEDAAIKRERQIQFFKHAKEVTPEGLDFLGGGNVFTKEMERRRVA